MDHNAIVLRSWADVFKMFFFLIYNHVRLFQLILFAYNIQYACKQNKLRYIICCTFLKKMSKIIKRGKKLDLISKLRGYLSSLLWGLWKDSISRWNCVCPRILAQLLLAGNHKINI